MPLTGAAKQTFFYPRLVYNAITIDFDDPVAAIATTEVPVAGRNIAAGSGKQETLYIRMEQQVSLTWINLEIAKITALRTYFRDWGAQGKQAALTLDRLNTCAGQYEYDHYNTLFDKAELIDVRLIPQRSQVAKALYTLTLIFRQGS